MRAELDEEDIAMIAERVIAGIKPLLGNNKVADDSILTVAGAADLLRVSRAQVYQWVNKSMHGLSAFPFMKAGRLLRFSKNELLEWMKSNDMVRKNSRNKSKVISK